MKKNNQNKGFRSVMLLLTSLSICFLFIFYQRFQTIEFSMIDGPIVNPLMGWAPWATIENSEQSHTLVYADLTWHDFEPEEGVFDFDSFEIRNQFDRWRVEGKRVVFRFVLDIPESEDHLDIPDWLYEKINGDGDHYDHDYGKGFSPNYSNPVLITYHQKAIQALGEQYGQDDFIAYIELGSLGHWGEWHIKSDSNIRPLPDEEIRNQYVQHYLDAFPNTYLLMRRPFTIAQDHRIGFYNDMTGDLESTNSWLDWIQYGGEFNQTREENALASLPEQWQIAPIGGEQTSSISAEEFYDSSLLQTIDLLQRSHTTFIGPNGAYRVQQGGSLQEGVDQILAAVGYRLYIEKARIPNRIIFGKNITIQLTFANGGIAPIYYDWPVFIYLFDEQGQIVNTFPVSMDIHSIIPGKTTLIPCKIPIDALPNGHYTLGIAIHDPASKLPAVQFAMQNSRDDRIQILETFQVRKLFTKQ